ncbi:MAG: hypothetical protein JHC95_16110 [Solirubrobacteraceae bacterium]|nr:hypothetical protein [Solirubrobacteraceae bacterium]
MRLRIAVLSLLAVAAAAAPAAAAPEPTRPAAAFTGSVGVNTHVMSTSSAYGNLGATRQALRTTGVRHIRDGIRGYLGSGDSWYWQAQLRRLGWLASDGVRLDLILPPADGSLGSTAAALLTALPLQDAIESFEPANEWDLQGPAGRWPEQIRRQTRQVDSELRALPWLRSVPLLAPSFGQTNSPVLVGDLSDVVDYGNAHPYANGGRPELPEDSGQTSLLENLGYMRLVSRDRPFMLTEAGYHNALSSRNAQRPVPEDVAAVYTLRTLLEHFRLGATRTFLYELVDEHPDPLNNQQEANWGLYRFDWTPKPAAVAIGNLLALLRDPEPAPEDATLDYETRGGGLELRTVALARPDGGFTLVLWRPESVWDHDRQRPIPVLELPVTVTFAQQFAVARVFRPLDGTAPVDQRTAVDAIDVAVGAEPVLLDLRQDAATVPAPSAEPVTVAGRIDAEIRRLLCRLARLRCPR